jgi:hypothetical protein
MCEINRDAILGVPLQVRGFGPYRKLPISPGEEKLTHRNVVRLTDRRQKGNLSYLADIERFATFIVSTKGGKR